MKKQKTEITAPEKLKPGPKPKPADALVLKKSVSLRPETYDGLIKLGGGVLSHGIETMYASKKKR